MECDVTIEDPLVSRQHARIVIEGGRVVIHDLNSRNGVKVNGQAIGGPTDLHDGDRVGIGTRELVFCRVEAADRAGWARATGCLRHCARCRTPYPKDAGACPSCGETESIDDETLTGKFDSAAQAIWSVQLLLEILERALSPLRVEHVNRILDRACVEIEDRIGRGAAVDPEQLAKLADAAGRAALAIGDPRWGQCIVQVYRRVPLLVPEQIVRRLGEIASRFPREMAEPIEQLAAHARDLAVSSGEVPVVAALDRIRSSVAFAGSSP